MYSDLKWLPLSYGTLECGIDIVGGCKLAHLYIYQITLGLTSPGLPLYWTS